MIRALSALLLSLVLITPATPAFAQDVLAKKVTIDVNAASPVSVFTAVATAAGASFTVTVDPAVTEPVDITVRSVSVKTALDAICESIGCKWTLSGNALVVRPLTSVKIGIMTRSQTGQASDKGAARARAQVVLDALKQTLPADLTFDNAPLDVVNARLSDTLKMKVELMCKDPGVKTITLDFGGRSLQSALQALGEQEGARGPWRLNIGPQAGDMQTPTIAIMVDPKSAKKK